MPFPRENETFKSDTLSPALLRACRTVLSPEDLQLFRQIFDLVCDSGALREVDFERAPDTSFNPRPARIAQICIDEGDIRDLPTLAVSVLSCCKHPISSSALPFDQNPDILLLSAVVHPIVELLEPIPHDLSVELRTVVSVHLLDRARQLHRAPPERIRAVAPAISQRITELLQFHPCGGTIESKLRFWLENRALPLISR